MVELLKEFVEWGWRPFFPETQRFHYPTLNQVGSCKDRVLTVEEKTADLPSSKPPQACSTENLLFGDNKIYRRKRGLRGKKVEGELDKTLHCDHLSLRRNGLGQSHAIAIGFKMTQFRFIRVYKRALSLTVPIEAVRNKANLGCAGTC